MDGKPERRSVDEIADFLRNFPLKNPELDRREIYGETTDFCETLWEQGEGESLLDFGILAGTGSIFEYFGRAIIVLGEMGEEEPAKIFPLANEFKERDKSTVLSQMGFIAYDRNQTNTLGVYPYPSLFINAETWDCAVERCATYLSVCPTRNLFALIQVDLEQRDPIFRGITTPSVEEFSSWTTATPNSFLTHPRLKKIHRIGYTMEVEKEGEYRGGISEAYTLIKNKLDNLLENDPESYE